MKLRSSKLPLPVIITLIVIPAIVIVYGLIFITNITDFDTDAYAHYIIAKELVINPLNFGINWVWLPLYHYLLAFAVKLHLSFENVRMFNLAIWVILSFVLFFYLRSQNQEKNGHIPLVSFIFTITFPIGMVYSTSAQYETFFVFLLLLFVVFAEKERYFVASVFLCLAVLTRYEAWFVLVVSGLYVLFRYIHYRNLIYLKHLVKLVFLPTTAILVWAILRLPYDGKFFGFLFETKEFVSGALDKLHPSASSSVRWYDFFYYMLYIPFLMMTINLGFVFVGIKRVWEKYRFLFLTGIAVILFISVSYVFKTNLGLFRHFIPALMIYSVLCAAGIEEVRLYLREKFSKSRLVLLFANYLAVIMIVVQLFVVLYWGYIWIKTYQEGFPDKQEVAEFLRSLPETSKILTNDAVIKVLSNLPYDRFDNYWLSGEEKTFNYITDLKRQKGEVYVVVPLEEVISYTALGNIKKVSSENPRTHQKLVVIEISG